jgi:hypothetical protein
MPLQYSPCTWGVPILEAMRLPVDATPRSMQTRPRLPQLYRGALAIHIVTSCLSLVIYEGIVPHYFSLLRVLLLCKHYHYSTGLSFQDN